MNSNSPLDNLPRTDRIDSTNPIGQDQKGLGTPQQSFSSYMQPGAQGPTPGTPQANLASPFDLAGAQTRLAAGPNFDTLLTQVTSAQSALGDLNSQLSNPNLKLKQSYKYLLKNKLTEASTHLTAANSKIGTPLENEDDEQEGGGPLAKFIGYVTSGQNKLEAAKRQLQEMKSKGDQMKPGDFLLIQVQLNLAQQSLEYSSVVLSKAMDDMKMLLNVQL